MIDYETYVRIRNYFENDGLRYSQIADALALDQRTVARWANEKRYLPGNQRLAKTSSILLKMTFYECLKSTRILRHRFFNE